MTDYYLFSIFLFILFSLFLLVFKYIMRPNIAAKDPNLAPAKENDENLFKLYQHLEDLLDGFEAYMEDIKDEIKTEREAVTGMGKNIEELCSKFDSHINKSNPVKAIEPAQIQDDLVNTDQVQVIELLNEVKKNIPQKERQTMDSEDKSKKVIELYKKGRKPETISKQLNMTKGEINLIIGLFNKKSKE